MTPYTTDRFGLPEAVYQDAMEMGNSLARAVIADPYIFQFDERVMCRAFCLSAKEEILAVQRCEALREQNKELRVLLQAAVDDDTEQWLIDAKALLARATGQ